MIQQLNYKDVLNVYVFVKNTNDGCDDFYITFDKERHFLTEQKIINKILKTQQCYGLFEQGNLEAMMIVYRSEGFRPYVKMLAVKKEHYNKLFKFLNWHHNEELFIKIKKYNAISNEAKKNRFFIEGFRGKEILLKRLKQDKIKTFLHHGKD